jgi:hypothetical protein
VRSPVIVALAVAVGCGSSPPVPDDLVAALTRRGGCGDIVMYAVNADDTLALVIRGEGLVDQAHAAGRETPFSYDLAVDDGLSIELRHGEHITHMTCNDAIEFEVVVRHRYAPVSGSALLVLTPTGEPEEWYKPADAVLTLTDLVLERDDGDRRTIDEMSFSANVGWYPG